MKQKKPRPPVKVDVNVRLVPKPGKEHKMDSDTGNTSKTPLDVKVNLIQPVPSTSETIRKRAQRDQSKTEKLEQDFEIPDLPIDDLELEDYDNSNMEQ